LSTWRLLFLSPSLPVPAPWRSRKFCIF
jgi:hypothetical protein